MNEELIGPEAPDPAVKEMRGFWRGIGKTMVRESIGTIDSAARQVIGVAGILEGLYFHAIAYSDLRGQVTGGWTLWIYVAPIALLLCSLVAALLVFVPDRYRVNLQSSQASRLIYERTLASKLLALRVSSGFLLLGVGAVFFAALTYLKG